MTTIRRSLFSPFAILSFTITACSPPLGESSDSDGASKESVRMESNIDANSLRDFLSGKEMTGSNGASGNAWYQRFFQSGVWESGTEEISYTRRKGRWSVQTRDGDRNVVCSTTDELNGQSVREPPTKCYIIEVNINHNAGLLIPLEDEAAGVSVKFHNITNQD